MNHGKTIEPLWWGLFSVGGVIAAFLVPIHILLNGLAVPLGWVADSGSLYQYWLVKIYLFVLITLPLYHWAHRFYFSLVDIGLKALRTPLAILCYGGAILGTVISAWVLLQL